MLRSQFATTMSLPLLLLALAISGTSAVYCDRYEDSWDGARVHLSTQEEVDAYFAGCTEIKGTINIARNYTGRFYLPNVTSISHGIVVDPGRYGDDSGDKSIKKTLLTSIEMPDLNDTYQIDINNAPALTTISFPNLTVLNGSLYIGGIEDCHVNFPSLTSINYDLQVIGNSTKLNFPVLASTQYLRVSRNPVSEHRLDDSIDNLFVDRVDQIPLDISFPALQNASSVYLQGNISSVSMPLLSLPSEHDITKIKIVTHGNPLNISLPNLSAANYISLVGTIGSFSFPALPSVKLLQINTSTPLNVSLEPLQNIDLSLRLYGNVTALSISSLTSFQYATIVSTVDGFDCGPFASVFKRIKGYAPDEDDCTGPLKNMKPLKLRLGIGLGVPLFLGIAWFVFWKRGKIREEQKLKGNKPPEYEMGVPPTYTADGPPMYDASEGDRGSEQSATDGVNAPRGDGSDARGEGASEHSAVNLAGARPGDESSARQEGASGRQAV